MKSSELIVGGRGKFDTSPTGGRVISVIGGKGGILKVGGGGIVRGGKPEGSDSSGSKSGGIANGAAGSFRSGWGKSLGTSGVSS